MPIHEQLAIDSVGAPKKMVEPESGLLTNKTDHLSDAERIYQRRQELQANGYYQNCDISIGGVSKVISAKNELKETGSVTE